MKQPTFTKELTIKNAMGFHIRPAGLFVETAMKFNCDIEVFRTKDNLQADGKSILSMLMLSAPCGSKLKIVTSGEDAAQAMESLEALVERGFDE